MLELICTRLPFFLGLAVAESARSGESESWKYLRVEPCRRTTPLALATDTLSDCDDCFANVEMAPMAPAMDERRALGGGRGVHAPPAAAAARPMQSAVGNVRPHGTGPLTGCAHEGALGCGFRWV